MKKLNNKLSKYKKYISILKIIELIILMISSLVICFCFIYFEEPKKIFFIGLTIKIFIILSLLIYIFIYIIDDKILEIKKEKMMKILVRDVFKAVQYRIDEKIKEKINSERIKNEF